MLVLESVSFQLSDIQRYEVSQSLNRVWHTGGAEKKFEGPPSCRLFVIVYQWPSVVAAHHDNVACQCSAHRHHHTGLF